MRKLFVMMIMYSCSPRLQTKNYEIYVFTNSECNYKLELKQDRNFLYSYNCLGTQKATKGTWNMSNDTIYFKVVEPNKIEELLSSQYLATIPDYGILEKKHTIVLDKLKLIAK